MRTFAWQRIDRGALLAWGANLRVTAAGALLLLGGCTSPPPEDAPATPPETPARRVILMICDGCGFEHVNAASLYEAGRVASQPYESFPVRLAASTFSADGRGYDPGAAQVDSAYVESGATDSAAAATALATGVKTHDRAVGVSVDGLALKTVLERAEDRGMSTGVVTSVPWSHATPASFVAHNPSRDDYAGIAQEMILRSPAEVIFGAGHPWFDDAGRPRAGPDFRYAGGEALWAAVVSGAAGGDADGDGAPDPWTLVDSRAGFQSLAAGPAPKRVLGVAPVATTLQQGRPGDAGAAPFEVPLSEPVPSLAEMTAAALNVLDGDADGFFLMVEGGAVDWASHAHWSGRMVEEMLGFAAAVRTVADWVDRTGGWAGTLLLVTADHETGHLTGPGGNSPLAGRGAGILPAHEWHASGHTNSLVPVFARGEGAELLQGLAVRRDPVRGPYLDNTEIADVMARSLEPSPAHPAAAGGRPY